VARQKRLTTYASYRLQCEVIGISRPKANIIHRDTLSISLSWIFCKSYMLVAIPFFLYIYNVSRNTNYLLLFINIIVLDTIVNSFVISFARTGVKFAIDS